MGGEDDCDGSLGIYFVYRKQMTQKKNEIKQILSEQNTKKDFVLRHLRPVHEVLSGVWKPLSGQIVNSFGQGKCTFDCHPWKFKYYASGNHVSTSSCMLRIEKVSTFNMTCKFHTNSPCIRTYFSCMCTSRHEHFHK